MTITYPFNNKNKNIHNKFMSTEELSLKLDLLMIKNKDWVAAWRGNLFFSMYQGVPGTSFIQMIFSKLGLSVFPSVSLKLHERDENWKRQYLSYILFLGTLPIYLCQYSFVLKLISRRCEQLNFSEMAVNEIKNYAKYQIS